MGFVFEKLAEIAWGVKVRTWFPIVSSLLLPMPSNEQAHIVWKRLAEYDGVNNHMTMLGPMLDKEFQRRLANDRELDFKMWRRALLRQAEHVLLAFGLCSWGGWNWFEYKNAQDKCAMLAGKLDVLHLDIDIRRDQLACGDMPAPVYDIVLLHEHARVP